MPVAIDVLCVHSLFRQLVRYVASDDIYIIRLPLLAGRLWRTHEDTWWTALRIYHEIQSVLSSPVPSPPTSPEPEPAVDSYASWLERVAQASWQDIMEQLEREDP